MKNNRGFTLVETLAVIVLLSVILSIAIPSISGVIARNNRNRYKEAAEMFGVLAKQRIEKDITIEYPSYEKCPEGSTDACSKVIILLDEEYIDIKTLKNIYDIEYGDSTKGSKSKAVFTYSSNKWNLEYVVLYDKQGKAAYLDSSKEYVVGSDNPTENPNLGDKTDYICTTAEKEGYCYAK